MADAFEKILVDGVRAGQIPARTQDARNWFRNTASGKRMNEAQLATLQNNNRAVGVVEPGSMYLFKYDAKYKAKLPYWDAMPLIFPFKKTSNGFYGMNVHYLQPQLRAKLMDGLYDQTNNTRYDQTTKVVMSAAFLNKAAEIDYIKPCIKRYLSSNVIGGFTYIHPSEWDIAMFMPLAQWQNSGFQTVYKQSRKIAGM